jgi:DNA-binding MarR family transcriptional regulator
MLLLRDPRGVFCRIGKVVGADEHSDGCGAGGYGRSRGSGTATTKQTMCLRLSDVARDERKHETISFASDARYEPENGDGSLSGETKFYTFSDRNLRSLYVLDFDLLCAFVAVAQCGGFRRAAERLHLTQSTVSQQIKRLELEAGQALFRRSTRAVALTDEGEMLLGDARRLLPLEEAARRRLAAPRATRCPPRSAVSPGSIRTCGWRFRSASAPT